jgi:hypothetical protein
MITGIPATLADLNALYPNIYDDTLFVARDNALMPGLVNQATGDSWATRYIPIYNQLTVATVSEGGTPTAQQFTKGTADTTTPAMRRIKAGLTDQRVLTDPATAGSDLAVEAGQAMATQVDTDLIGEFANFTADAGAVGSALTLRRVAGAIARLQTAAAHGRPNVVLHPYQWFSVWVELTQAGVTTRSGNPSDTMNQAMRDYLVSDLQGADWYTTNVLGTGTAKVGGAFLRPGLMLDTRVPLSPEVQRDADSMVWWYFWNMGYDVASPRKDHGVKLTADASAPTF